MINGHYFPFESSLLHDDKVDRLTNKLGAAGFGVYVLLLNELRYRENYRCSVRSLRKVAGMINADLKMVKQVVYDFGLFNIEEKEDETYFFSDYMLRVMDNLEQKRRKCSEAGKKSAKARKKKSEMASSNDLLTIEKKRVEKNKSEKKKTNNNILKTTSITASKVIEGEDDSSSNSSSFKNNDITKNASKGDGSALNYIVQRYLNGGGPIDEPVYKSGEWVDHVHEIFEDEEWTKRMDKHTKMKGNFFTIFWDVIIQEFKDHVILQTTDSKPMTLNEIKVYFANFMRPDTHTYERVKDKIETMFYGNIHDKTNGFETLSRKNKRRYYGIPIPDDAPPRPDKDSHWNSRIKEWEYRT